jgi:hypothetical protein
MFTPDTPDGKRLLAHELTHVTQQGGSGEKPDLQVHEDPALESEAEQAGERIAAGEPFRPSDTHTARAIQRQGERRPFRLLPDRGLEVPPDLATAQPLLRPGELPEAFVIPAPPEVRLENPSQIRDEVPFGLSDRSLRLTPPNLPRPVTIIPVPRCVPSTPLTWSNFRGTPPAGNFSARTVAPVTLLNIQGNPMFQARMNESASWVRPRFANASNRALNGCATAVTQCQQAIQQGQAGLHFSGAPSPGCPASIVASAAAVANTGPECDTVLGAECDRAAQAESARLLRHEQGHFDISCVIANKASDALRTGSSVSSVSAALAQQLQATHNLYDQESVHGCNAGQQSSWETAISAQLPAVTIP